MKIFITIAFLLVTIPAWGQNLKAVQIYSDDELLSLIKENAHLSRVVLDECQLVQDIEARAVKSKKPAYQYLWGDMLAFGVCVKKDVELGFYYMKKAAAQGLPEGLEQVGRYYHQGKLVQQDMKMALRYLKNAAWVGNLNAQLRLADIYNDGLGSPLDYPTLYRQLHKSVTGDKEKHIKISKALAKLETKMPPQIVAQAKWSN